MSEAESNHGPSPRQIPDSLSAVGPGWHDLLLQLHEHLVGVKPDYRVVDIGEKLGALRVNFGNVPASQRRATGDLLAVAVAQSSATCEFCGGAGNPRRRNDSAAGWIKTVCADCFTMRSQHKIMILGGAVRRRETGPQ